jgi:hypothetical protein
MNPNFQVTTQGREVISEVIKTGTMNSTSYDEIVSSHFRV